MATKKKAAVKKKISVKKKGVVKKEAATPKSKAKAKGVRLDPIAKAKSKPTSLKFAIRAMCYDCEGRDADRGWRKRVRECSIDECPLHHVRPYKA